MLRDGLSFVTESERTIVELSWNSDQLTLPLNAIVTFSYEEDDREGDDLHPPAPTQTGTLTVERLSQVKEAHHNVTFSACPELIAARFDVDVSALKPRMLWRRRSLLWRVTLPHKDSLGMSGPLREARLRVDAETSYYDVETGLLLAYETEVRARALEGVNQAGLTHQLTHRPHLPSVSAYWMSEYHYKRLRRLPTHQDLTGYEYEAKLSVDHLDLDELPGELSERYEIIERYQTESVRWYIRNAKLSGIGKVKKGRVGFRGPRASLVSKGKKQKLEGGILKRSEEKSQGLNTWELSQVARDAKEMRRIKRQLYIRSHQTKRVYALCLDYCYVEASTRAPLLQVELEYNGQLLLESGDWALTFERQLELAERFLTSSPKVAQRSLERASWLQPPTLSEELQARLEQVQTSLESAMAEQGVEESEGPPEVEAEVLSEMRELLRSLRRGYGFKETSKTKREWLRGELETIDREPLL